MRLPFEELPGEVSGHPRPIVRVAFDGHPDVRHLCLIDSGTLHNRFGSWAAEVAGIDLSDAEPSRIAVGGIVTDALTVPVALTLADQVWQAPVSFCDPWPIGFQLLGQEGFLRFFDLRIRASRYELELEPDW